MVKISLLFCLIVLATLCTAQTYGDLEFPSTNPVLNFNPCTQLFYTFTIPEDDFTGTNYLEIIIEATSDLSYAISQTELTYGDLDVFIPFGAANATVNVVCDFNSTVWYLVLANEGNVPVNFTLDISSPFVGVTPLEINENEPVNSNGYDFSSYESSSDFYGITFTAAPPQFSALEITIISSDPNNTVSSAQINFGGLPYVGCQSSVAGSEKTVIFVDYCTLQYDVMGPNYGTYFVSVTPENENTLSYSIEVTNPAPLVTNLLAGTNGLTGYLLAEGETNFYSISAQEGNVLNITLTDIINGELTVDVNYGNLPFFECVSVGNIISQDTSTSCQLIVDYCQSISGIYYVGVQVKSIDNPSLPISYRIFYNQFPVPNPESLEDNEYTTGVISQSFYSHYEFDSSNFNIDEDTLLNVRLYVDTYNLGSTSYDINLFVNFDEPAGPLDSCWSNIAQCTIVTGNDESSCTIQIDPCLFNDHENWYASVFASDDLIESRVIQYTIIANLENPTELLQEYEIVSSSVYDQNYDHYYLPADLFSLGYQVNILITSVSNDVELYVNSDGTLAGEIVCPACYNNTGSQSIGDDISYAVTSCPNAEIEDDFYFSIQGRNTNAFSSYSVMYALPPGLVVPGVDLAPDTLAVGTIAPGSAVNYTLGISSFSDENQLIIKLSSQNTTGDLSMTLYNTTYLNCLDGFEMYSCTIEDSGYCTFTVPPCVFTTSDGFMLSLSNADRNDPVNFNLEFSNQEVPTTTLTNGGTIVNEIGQFQYDLYEYEVQGGAATLIVEVVFFDDGTYNPTGYLNISTLPLSTGPCYPDGIVFTCESDTKCVFVSSSCNLQGETINIAVYTAYELLPDLPLKYSIVAREFSTVVPLPPVVSSQSTYTGQIYPGQQVYHTFQSTPNSAAGSQVTFQLSGDVTAVISQNAPPTPSTCPCFEYYPGATIPNSESDTSLTLEYCEQLSGTYTILVETTTNQNPATLITYTLVASTFSLQPVALVLDTVVPGQVILDYYQYFTIPTGSDAISVYVTNIVGGSIEIYYSGTGVATTRCSEGQIPCTTPDSSCVAQLPTCESISYLSIYGVDADTASPITFNIVISAQNRTVLAEGDPTGNTTLAASFMHIYSFTIDEEDYTAPIVTFTLSNISPGNANYQISAFTNDLCSSDFVDSVNIPTLSVPFCQIQDDDLFFYVASNETTRTIAYTAQVDVIDVADNTQILTLGTPETVDLDQDDWVTFTYSQPALNANQQSSLTFTISPPLTAYFSFGYAPALQCSDETNNSGTFVVQPCCLKEGDYYISFQSSRAATTTYTVEVQSTIVSFTEQLQIGTPSTTTTVLLGQTAEFVFQVPTDYDILNILVSSNQNVDVSFERITQAGDNTCYTDFTSVTCRDELCGYQIAQCDNFVGTMYVAVSPSTAAANVSVNVITSIETNLNADGNAVQLTAQANVENIYSISIPQDALLPNQELSVTITSNNVSFSASLSPESLCAPTNLGSCDNEEEECTITSLLCSTPELVILSIIADNDADITVTAAILTEEPTALTAGTDSNKPEDDEDINLYSFTIDDTTTLQYVTVSIAYNSLTTNFAASWRYYSPAPNGLYCLPTDDSENMCTDNYSQDNTNNVTTCNFIIEPCELAVGNYLVQVIAANSGDTYTVSYSISDATPTSINIGDIIYGTVDEDQNLYYELPFSRSSILPGQSFEITLDVTCGSADLYINQEVLAGPICSVSSDATFVLDACDLLESSVTSSPSAPFYLTVAGSEPEFPQYGVPSSFSLSSAIVGQAINFVPIGPNQAIQFDGSATIYTYNVAGINDFTGELAFTLTLPSDLLGASATVYVSADVPYHPLLPCTTEFTTLASNQAKTSFFENSCAVDSVRMFYISFDASSSENATVMVSRTKQYVRDLNEYDYYPQSGAVVGNPVTFNIVDEEYYEIEIDPTVPGFRFQATLTTPELGHARLLTSLDHQPSACDTIDPSFTCTSQNTNSECEIDLEYCEFDGYALPHVYLTVNTDFNSATPVPYNLSITQTVDEVTLTPNTAICGASNTTWTWFTLPSTTSNTFSFYEFQIYSVSINEFVNVYLNTEGLATSRCNQYSSLACTRSCSIVYSCDGFTGSFSIGVEKPNIDTSYFIVASPITITPVVLTSGESHSSTDDTPVAIDGTDYYFYSFTAPTLNVANGDSLVLAVSSETHISVSYNTNSPSINCPDDESAGTSVVFFVNSCDYVASTIYVTVSGSSDFTIEYEVLTTTVTNIPLNSYVEDSLAIDSTGDSFPSFISYSFDVSNANITTYDAIIVNTYGINQGELQIWITENQIADRDCAVEYFNNTDTVTLNTCDLTAGTYFINVLLLASGQNTPCLPVTFGILVATESPVTPINVVPLASGTASFSSAFFTDNLYTFTPANPTTSVVSVTTISTVPLIVTNECVIIKTPVQYYFGCSAQTDYSFTVTPTLTSTFTPPTTNYSITATTSAIAPISSTPTTVTFDQNYEVVNFYSFAVDSEVSLEIFVNVTIGPSVDVQLWSSECEDGANILIDQFTCYFGLCVIPVSQRQGVVANTTDSVTYYVTVSGYAPSKFVISVNQGEEETCTPINEDDLDFCTIVNWSTWGYDSASDIIQDQDETAERRFDYLYLKFCPPCLCQELSEACNTSLTEYVCTQTFRACDYEGFETSICLTSCQDVEQNCGATFEEIGLPELSCNHNFYLAEDDAICTEIYQTTSSNSDLILWIIVGVVLFIVVVVLLAVTGFVVYKQIQAKRRASSYEVLE